VPLKVGEQTLGDHLRKAGMDCWLVGKTHMRADTDGMERLGLRPDSVIGARAAECGFDVWERDDGMRPEGPDGLYDEDGAAAYNDYLRANGYEAENPWHDFANSGRDENGQIASGWFLKNAARPAAIPDEHSETPYLTTRAMEFIESRDDTPWCLHLSYIKPHWPYIVPEPYFSMYGADDVAPPNRADDELTNAHPVYAAFAEGRIGKAFSRDEVRKSVIPAYMGLIKQADDQMGRLFDWLEETGRMEDTMIVLTSDHGDYLGDHWIGEKDLFHDPSVRVPLIVYDPSTSADTTRGTVSDQLIETIDLAPTFVAAAGGAVADHILEGRSLLPILHGKPHDWRDYAISEYDYSITPAAVSLGTSVRECNLVMVCDTNWKFMHADGFRPMLFDLKNDPDELHDLGDDPAYDAIFDKMYDRLLAWALRPSQRTTRSADQLIKMRTGSKRKGVVLGIYDETEIDPELVDKYLP
jgi:arylsulfatase A-like enzyme